MVLDLRKIIVFPGKHYFMVPFSLCTEFGIGNIIENQTNPPISEIPQAAHYAAISALSVVGFHFLSHEYQAV